MTQKKKCEACGKRNASSWNKPGLKMLCMTCEGIELWCQAMTFNHAQKAPKGMKLQVTWAYVPDNA